MKSKTPLVLLEQLVMVLVFALAAALCLRCFVLSDKLSEQNALRDQAVLTAQSAAEMLKSCEGDYEQVAALLNGQWTDGVVEVRADKRFSLRIVPMETEIPLLGSASVEVYDRSGNERLFDLTVAWQEVDKRG